MGVDKQVHLHNTFKVGYKPDAPYNYRERDLPSENRQRALKDGILMRCQTYLKRHLNERGFECFIVKDRFLIVNDFVSIFIS